MGRTGALDVAASVLHGETRRTSTSVIGQHAGETVIFSITSWGFSVSVTLAGLRLTFRAEASRRKPLAVEGHPAHKVRLIVNEEMCERLQALAPVEVRLAANGLHLEKEGGTPDEIREAIGLMAALAQRLRQADRQSGPIAASLV